MNIRDTDTSSSNLGQPKTEKTAQEFAVPKEETDPRDPSFVNEHFLP